MYKLILNIADNFRPSLTGLALFALTISATLSPVSVENAYAGEVDLTTALSVRSIGRDDAPVTLIEYASLGCSHCKSFHDDTYPIIKKDYIDTGLVRLEFRDYPLGTRAMAASMLTRCAPESMYFGMVGLFFDKQSVWGQSEDPIGALSSVAKHAMMTPDDVTACLQNKDLMNGIRSGAEEASNNYGIQSTPTFFIGEAGGTRIEGAQDIDVFRAAIEDALN